jgi:hypothetical protein
MYATGRVTVETDHFVILSLFQSAFINWVAMRRSAVHICTVRTVYCKCSLLVMSDGTVGRNFRLPFCKAHRNVAVCIAVYRLQATIALGYRFDDPGFDSCRGNRVVTLSTRLYVLPKLVLSGASPPHTFLVIVLFIGCGLFNRTVETSGPVPAVPCLSCTTTTPSRSIEPGAFCTGAVWLGLSGEFAASILAISRGTFAQSDN